MAKDKPVGGAKRKDKGKGKRARADRVDVAPAVEVPAAVAPADGTGSPRTVPRVDDGRLSFGVTRLANALGGASLCFGEPIAAGERVVVPVARVRGAGGAGFGRGRTDGEGDGDGGGGGGALEATPAGFLDITPDGVRYEAIPDPVTTARALSTGASALTLLVSAVVGVRRVSRRRAAATALLPPP